MAIIDITNGKDLLIEFDNGMVNGKSTSRTKVISNLAIGATNAALHSLAITLAGLQSKSLLSVKSRTVSSLVEE